MVVLIQLGGRKCPKLLMKGTPYKSAARRSNLTKVTMKRETTFLVRASPDSDDGWQVQNAKSQLLSPLQPKKKKEGTHGCWSGC